MALGSILCEAERDPQRERFLRESSNSIALVQEWPCFGHLKDLPSGAALLLAYDVVPANLPAPWLSGSGAILEQALIYYRGFHGNDPHGITRTATQSIVASMHLYPAMLMIKRHRRCVRNISDIKRGTEWIPVPGAEDGLSLPEE